MSTLAHGVGLMVSLAVCVAGADRLAYLRITQDRHNLSALTHSALTALGTLKGAGAPIAAAPMPKSTSLTAGITNSTGGLLYDTVPSSSVMGSATTVYAMTAGTWCNNGALLAGNIIIQVGAIPCATTSLAPTLPQELVAPTATSGVWGRAVP